MANRMGFGRTLWRAARLGAWTTLVAGPLLGAAGCMQKEYEQCIAAKKAVQSKWQACQQDLENLNRQIETLRAQLARAKTDATAAKSATATMEKKLGVLQAERKQKEQMYLKLLDDLKKARSRSIAIPKKTEDRLKAFAKQHKGFTFDEKLGVSKFQSDIVFDEGKALVKAEAAAVLGQFADIFKSDEARELNLLVVGHTDDQPITFEATRKKHPTNWHLSVHRAIEVLNVLSKAGIAAERLGVSGYGEYQPVAPNTDEPNRQKNRRVEIYVVRAPLVGAAAE